MIKEIELYLEKYDESTRNRVQYIYELIIKSVESDINERLWAKLPSYYLENKFVRIIPFRTHINIEAEGLSLYRKELNKYKFTEKGMLQIFNDDEVPVNELEKVFRSTFEWIEHDKSNNHYKTLEIQYFELFIINKGNYKCLVSNC